MNAQLVRIRGREHPVLPAADPSKDSQPKRVKVSMPRTRLPHYHPLSSYKWRKRSRKEQQGPASGDTGVGVCGGADPACGPPAGFKLLA